MTKTYTVKEIFHSVQGEGFHMLRGMQCVKWEYPFASVDSTDVARNHAQSKRGPKEMASRWDSMQCPSKWIKVQEDLFNYA